MPLTEDIVGMHYRYPDHYMVEREKIREYAVAVQNDESVFFEENAAAELGGKGFAEAGVPDPTRYASS